MQVECTEALWRGTWVHRDEDLVVKFIFKPSLDVRSADSYIPLLKAAPVPLHQQTACDLEVSRSNKRRTPLLFNLVALGLWMLWS